MKELRDKKHELATHLANLLRFVWRCYWKKKLKKKKKKKGKKGKKKANKDLSQTMMPLTRKDSIVGSAKASSKGQSPSKLGK